MSADFITTILTYLSGTSGSVRETVPYLQSPGVTYTAFAWAIPPAIIAGYSLYMLHNMLVRRSLGKHRPWTNKMVEVESVVVLMFLLVSFIVTYYGHFSYLLIPCYASIIVVMVFLLPKLSFDILLIQCQQE